MKHTTVETCKHCGGDLELGWILQIENCPTCDGPVSRRWIMIAFWGIAMMLAVSLFLYFIGPDLRNAGFTWPEIVSLSVFGTGISVLGLHEGYSGSG